MNKNSHFWIRAASQRSRAETLATLRIPPVLAKVDAHRLLRGPYTAAGSVLRAVVPTVLPEQSELVAAHGIEILTAAPETQQVLPPIRRSLMMTQGAQERAGFFPSARTLSIANGLAEFLRDYVRALGDGPRALVVDNAHQCDPTDAEFLSVLLRRLDPAELTVVVATGLDAPEPPETGEPSLGTALHAHAKRVTHPEESGAGVAVEQGAEALARAYVDSDGTSDEPAEVEAYHRLSVTERAALHQARAAELEALDEVSLTLGALPFHRERGSDPAGAASVLAAAADHCLGLGLFSAALNLAQRGTATVADAGRTTQWAEFAARAATALTGLGRLDEAAALLDGIRAANVPLFTRISAYRSGAMVEIARAQAEGRDSDKVTALITTAMDGERELPEGGERELAQARSHYVLAMAAFDAGNLQESRRLVDEGLARLDRVFAPQDHQVQRLMMIMHRAAVNTRLSEYDLALGDYAVAVAIDPDEPRIYFERAGLHSRRGHLSDAIADYEEAARLSPPYPEIHYNLANTRVELGDVRGAVADFGRVIEVDPSMVDAFVNRAGLLCDLGESERAWADVRAGLLLAPQDAHLLCLKGRLLAEANDVPAAQAALSGAVAADADLAEAWAIRGVLAYESGDITRALDDLDQAIGLTDDPAVRFNRAVARQKKGLHTEAIKDYDRVLAAGDDPDARYQRGVCHLRNGDQQAAQRDFLSCLISSPTYADSVRRHIPELAE
jgi:tetratricopeptide (TPR) repeat protein